MANKKAVTGKSDSASEFSRGHEHGYDGGKMAINSPFGSAFNYPHRSENVMEKTIREQGGGRTDTSGGKK